MVFGGTKSERTALNGQSRTMCLIECGSLHTDGLFFVFYDMYVGEVGMTDFCSGIDNFGKFKSYS